MNTKNSLTLAFAAACLLAQFAAPARAAGADNAQEVSRAVRIDDLDLSTAAGSKTLQARLNVAIKQVCREIWAPVPGQLIQNGKCRNALLEQAAATMAGLTGNSAGRFVATSQYGTIHLAARRSE